MSRYTRLERAAMAALAHDLRAEIPDLAGQFEESHPSQRRNSGFGLFTEMVVDRHRPAPPSGPTGDFGAVHVMVGALPDPVAFKARFRNGVLLGLLGDSYGQDTRGIDFATVSFDQVFTVDAAGVSIPFEPARHMPPSPLLDLHRHTDHLPPRVEPPVLRNVGALQRVQEVERPAPQIGRDAETGTPIADQTSLLVGLWVLIAVIALLMVFAFRLPFAFGVFVAIFAGRAVKDPKVLSRISAAVNGWTTAAATRRD
ncbi:hypothetical protein [Brevundimonas sp. FT23042]|uniref:hypothetical protein n=1 Tax=Brevundimonas sp. FT23042 TaxID=3393749 RepID=UPI003B58AC8C